MLSEFFAFIKAFVQFIIIFFASRSSNKTGFEVFLGSASRAPNLSQMLIEYALLNEKNIKTIIENIK